MSMPSQKYLNIGDHEIERNIPDFDGEGDAPGSGENSTPFAVAMLAEIDGDRGPAGPDKWTDAEHVVNCFTDAVAGLLHGLSVRIAPGQMKEVVEQLIPHVSHTMRWVAQDEDKYHGDKSKEENEQEVLEWILMLVHKIRNDQRLKVIDQWAMEQKEKDSLALYRTGSALDLVNFSLTALADYRGHDEEES
jgi:hypothetical protein